jgi:hypothetical protein
MEQNNFFIIEAQGLQSPSRKPKHLEKRFGNRSLPGNSCALAVKKHEAFLSARKQKLRVRSSSIEMAIQKTENERKKAKMSKLNQIEEALANANKNRERILKFETERHANQVKRAKEIARLQSQKSREDIAALERNLKSRMRVSDSRRQKFLKVPRSKLDSIARKESLAVRDAAALTIQDWWRYKKFMSLMKVYRKVGITKSECKSLSFPALMKRVQNPVTIKATNFVIIRAKRTTGKKFAKQNPARVLLSAYVLAFHPNEMLTTMDPQEEDLSSLAEKVVEDLEFYTGAISAEVVATLAKSFFNSFMEFFEAFEAWKNKDTEKIVDELIFHFMELDKLWVSVYQNENAFDEWAPAIQSQQKMHLTRIKRFGDYSIDKLLKIRHEFQSQVIKETGLKINSEAPNTASADVLYVAPPSIAVDTVMEVDNVAEKPNDDDLTQFGHILSNEQLAHELVMDPNFSLKPAERSPFEEEVAKIAKKAFAESLEEEISRGEYTRQCLGVLLDIKKVF